MKTGIMTALAVAAIFLAAPTQAQNLEDGAAVYKNECRACHGPTAKGLASYPRLTGHSVEYLVDRLERYRAGEKIGPNTPLMAPRAKKLSDDDILNISTFIVETFQ